MRRALVYSRSYRQAVMALNPVGYWRLGEASGTVAVDEIGLNHGTYVNTPTLGVPGLLAGDPNAAVTFAAASSEYVEIADAPALRLAVDWSVMCWLRTTNAAQQQIVSKRSVAPAWEVVMGGQIAGRIDVWLSDGVNTFGALSAKVINDGAIHQVAVVRSGVNVTFVIDGVVDTVVVTTVTGSTAGTDPLCIATYGNHGGNFFDGTIDEPAIWDRALTAAEIARLYQIGRGF